MEQITGIFHFTEKYRHTNRTDQEVTVKLEIDYRSKTFSIAPPYGSDNFKFLKTSKNYKMWLAVLNCIQKAIEFANMEIGVTPEQKKN
jgi:hypothetical protein